MSGGVRTRVPVIEIDADLYPTLLSVRRLRNWHGAVEDVPRVLDAVADAFEVMGYGRGRRRGHVWRFATGGWSGCEELIENLPMLVRTLTWRSSHRGGLHVYTWEVK